MSHTDGPWINDASHPEWERNVIWANDVVVAHVVDDQHGNADANASLISAAPELLAAARAALADMEGIMPAFDCDGERQHPGWKTIEELRAAIAKAEGRE
jgi:hypothetical protein